LGIICPTNPINAPVGQMIPNIVSQGVDRSTAPPVQAASPVQPQPTTGQSGSLNGQVGMTASMIEHMYGPDVAKAYLKTYEPTEATQLAVAAGMNPSQANADVLATKTHIAPTALRSGAGYLDKNNVYHTTPSAAPEGYMNVDDPTSSSGFKVVPVGGALDAIQNSARSHTAGTKGYPAAGNGVGSSMPPGVPSSFGPTSDAAIGAFGTGQERAQTELSTKWAAQQAASKEAQSTASYLRNIKTLAQTAATGPGADKKEYVNGLLSLAGVSEKATDATTANNLMNKYKAQIVTRLSQAGMNTDAARNIAESATPGSHMNLPAITEAADNLIGASDMQSARTRLLSNHAANRDPQNYQMKEIEFDNAATPEVYQYHSIAGTPQGAAFLKQQIAKDPNFVNRIKTIDSLGGF